MIPYTKLHNSVEQDTYSMHSPLKSMCGLFTKVRRGLVHHMNYRTNTWLTIMLPCIFYLCVLICYAFTSVIHHKFELLVWKRYITGSGWDFQSLLRIHHTVSVQFGVCLHTQDYSSKVGSQLLSRTTSRERGNFIMMVECASQCDSFIVALEAPTHFIGTGGTCPPPPPHIHQVSTEGMFTLG